MARTHQIIARRTFLKSSMAAVITPYFIPSSVLGVSNRLTMGMIGYCVEDDLLGETTDKLVKEIIYNSPLIIRLNKRAVKKHLGLDFNSSVEGVSDLFLNELMKTEDTLEGIASFEEKRRPVWKNK